MRSFAAYSKEIANDSITDYDSRYHIDLKAVQHNLTTIRDHLPDNTRLMMVVKANGYGIGAVPVTQFVKSAGVDIVAVTHIDEAIELRQAGLDIDIFVFNATVADIDKVLQWRVETAVSDMAFLHALAKRADAANRTAKVHVHLDSGMTRLGAPFSEALALGIEAHRLDTIELVGLMTHFPSADDASQDAFTLSQAKLLRRLVTELAQQGIAAPWIHAANSAAALRFDLPFCTMARIGISAYGLVTSTAMENPLPLRCALSLTSSIVGINHPAPGATVSYGRTYVVRHENAKVGVVPLGYCDGIHRLYSGKGSVLIGNTTVPIIGTVCMDYFMVDVTSIPDVAIGDQVLLFGYDQQGNFRSPEMFAEEAGTIAHELITCIGPRVPRVFVGTTP